jgi:hypothetical protein
MWNMAPAVANPPTKSRRAMSLDMAKLLEGFVVVSL